MKFIMLAMLLCAPLAAQETPDTCPVVPSTTFGWFFGTRPVGPPTVTQWNAGNPDFINWGKFTPGQDTHWLCRCATPGVYTVKVSLSLTAPLTTPVALPGQTGPYLSVFQPDAFTIAGDNGWLAPYIGPEWGQYTWVANNVQGLPGSSGFGVRAHIPPGIPFVYVAWEVWRGAQLINTATYPGTTIPINPACYPPIGPPHSETGWWFKVTPTGQLVPVK